MKAYSLFSGIGGFDLALKNKGYEIVGCCELDDFARQIYAKHFGTAGSKDATKLNPENIYEVPDHDILCAGFPCPTFSVAGRRLGLKDKRGRLFFEIIRIARQKRPRYLLLENVKGLLSHDNGRTFAIFLSALDELGYDAEWQVLNSKYWVPQNRERIFIIGYLRNQPRPEIFPLGASGDLDKEETPGKGEQPFISNAIDSNYWKGPDKHGQRTVVGFSKSGRSWGTEARVKYGEANTLSTSDGCSNKSSHNYVVEPKLQQVANVDQKGHNSIWGRVYNPDGLSSTLGAEGGGLGAKTGLYAVPIKFLNRNQRNMPKEQAMTVDTKNSSGITDGMAIRKLTPLECERLQGFPDNWTEGISDTQRYKCLGNAVTVPVVEHIVDLLANC